MQVIYKRAGIVGSFLVLILLLLGNAWVTKRKIEAQIRDHALLIHTQDMIRELTQVALLLDDAETGQRGFLYTNRPEYLVPYSHAATEIDSHIQSIAKMTLDNPRQQSDLLQLQELTHKKLDELRETIALHRAGKIEETRALVLSGRGQATMKSFRRVVAQMEQEEEQLESQRTLAYSQTVTETRLSIYLATILAVLGAMLLAYYILRQMRLRDGYESELREREEWYRVTLTSIGDAVIATDEKGFVTFINPVAERLTGCNYLYAAGKPVAEVFPIYNEYTNDVVENPVQKVMAAGRVVGLANHTVLKRRDGTLTPIEDSAAPIRNDRQSLVGVVLVFRDATVERERQEIVRRAEKLAAASRLASTVAHEINNPLEAIGNLVYLAKSTVGISANVQEYLISAEEQLERVSHITKQTLAFYRESGKWESVDLVSLIDSVLNLYSNKLKSKNISVEKHYGARSLIRGSAGELKQVIANLISNGIDAVSVNGRLRVSVSSSLECGEDAVLVTIEDDGPGVAAENIESIFEPFFTTKEDVGTGLGLWVTKEIIERHGGTIWVRSGAANALPGAAFMVCLPSGAKNSPSVVQDPEG